MKPGNIPHQIVETIPGHFPGAVEVNTVKALHNIRVVGDFKIRDRRLPILLNLHVLTVIPADGHAGINYVGNAHHDRYNLFSQLLFLLLQPCKARGVLRHLLFKRLCLLFLSLAHQRADLLGYLIFPGAQIIRFLFHRPVLYIQLNDLIHQAKLAVLKFIPDILLHSLRIFPDKL